MFLFFYGENDFLLKQKLCQLEQRYKATTDGGFSFMKVDGENFDFENFAANVQAVPLFSSSRLIEVTNILKNKDKTIHERTKAILGKIPKTTVVVFVEIGLPDKRLALFKALNVKKQTFEFKVLEGSGLDRFIAEEVEKRNFKIERSAVTALHESVGDDLWRLVNEIDKLVCYCDDTITLPDVERLVTKNISGNVFELVESISSGRKIGALSAMEKILASGEPVLKTVAVINYQFRTIAQIKSALDKTTDQYQLAKICSLSPFQVSKNMKFARSISWRNLSSSFSKLVFFDEAIKSGKISDVEGLKELVMNL